MVENAVEDDPAAAAAGIGVCRTILARFPDEPADNRACFQASLGYLQYWNGEPGRGEATLRAMIAADPSRAIGYVYLARALAECDFPWHDAARLDVPAAIAVLEEAEAAPVADGDDFDLALMLRDLRSLAN